MKKLLKTTTIILIMILGSAGLLYGQEALHIDSAGNVGIGTRNPNARLEINTKGSDSASLKCDHSASNFIVRPLSAGSKTTVIENIGGGGLSINPNNGNLIIGGGTSTPISAKLVIGGKAGEEGLDLASSDQYANLRVLRNSRDFRPDKDMFIGYGSGDLSSLHFYSNNKESLTITAGNVGIGSSKPIAKLDVAGDINFSNAIKINGKTVLSGNPGDVNGNIRVLSNQSETNADGMHINYNSKGGASAHIHFFANGDAERMRISADNGYVGIGTKSPQYPLDVKGYKMIESAHPKNMERDGRPLPNTGEGFSPKPITIQAEWGFLAGGGYYLTSDKRIKKSFTVPDSYKDLDLLNHLKVTSFQYKNTLVNGNAFTTGFIAQDIEEIFPQAVNRNTDFIPDIYKICDKNSLTNKLLTVSLKDAHNLRSGEMVRLITEKNETREVTVNVSSANSFTVENWEGEAGKIFVYGKKVNDFKSVDYNQIFSLGISAIQELSKQVDMLKAENNDLKNKNIDSKAESTAMLQSLTAMQSQLALLQKKVDALTTIATVNK